MWCLGAGVRRPHPVLSEANVQLKRCNFLDALTKNSVALVPDTRKGEVLRHLQIVLLLYFLSGVPCEICWIIQLLPGLWSKASKAHPFSCSWHAFIMFVTVTGHPSFDTKCRKAFLLGWYNRRGGMVLIHQNIGGDVIFYFHWVQIHHKCKILSVLKKIFFFLNRGIFTNWYWQSTRKQISLVVRKLPPLKSILCGGFLGNLMSLFTVPHRK